MDQITVDEKIQSIARANGWNDIELEHAIDNLDVEYGEECVVKLPSGRELRTPAYPEECSYVRIVQQGYELAYWVSDEWADDPECVMGAIVGCMKG